MYNEMCCCLLNPWLKLDVWNVTSLILLQKGWFEVQQIKAVLNTLWVIC